jgi:transcriptional regulator with XRE-family HTH domain
MPDISAKALIIEARTRAGLTQQQLAERAGTAQSAIARLENGQANPSFATLERLVAAAGFTLRVTLAPRKPPDPVVEAYKRDVDRTLLRDNLRKSVDQRLLSMIELKELSDEMRRGVKRRTSRSR